MTETPTGVTTEDLARELDVPLGDVEVHVDRLRQLDGDATVIVAVVPTGTRTGSYPDVLTYITDEAADAVREAVDVHRRHG